MLVVTGLIAVGAALLVTPNEMSALSASARREKLILSHGSDPKYREFFPAVAFYRKLDGQLAPDARIFFSGMIERPKLYQYFFANTYLFPREVQISLDRKPIYRNETFDGVDSDSPDEVRKHGFDVMLKVEKDGNVSVTPLTPKGALKQ